MVVGVKDYDQAAQVARELVDQGVTAIELCGGFGQIGVARVAEAVGDKAFVGVVRFDRHPGFGYKSGDELFVNRMAPYSIGGYLFQQTYFIGMFEFEEIGSVRNHADSDALQFLGLFKDSISEIQLMQGMILQHIFSPDYSHYFVVHTPLDIEYPEHGLEWTRRF